MKGFAIGFFGTLITLALLFVILSACETLPTRGGSTTDGSYNLDRVYDQEAGVVCWVYSSPIYEEGGLSCLPISETKLRIGQ